MTENFRAILLITASALLSACASQPADTSMDTESEIDAAFAQSAAPAPGEVQIPESVTQDLMPDLTESLSGIQQVEAPRFDLKVQNAPAQAFFMGLVEGTPENMVVHPEVTGEITLSLKNVSVDDVMQTVRDVYGYAFKQTNTGYLVLPRKLQTRVYQLNYLNIARNGLSQTIVSSGNITQGADNGSSSGSGSSSSSSSNTETVPSSQIETESDSDFWSEFAQSIEAIIGTEDGRRAIINPQTGVLLVKAMPDELRDLEEFLDLTQTTLQRQVIIEAKIIEVRLNDGFQTGINWAAIGEPETGETVTVGQIGGGTSLNSSGVSEISGLTGILNPVSQVPIEGTYTSAFGGVFTVSALMSDFGAFIELLKSQGDVQVLSSPRVSTINNQKAVIKVGTDEFFVTDISNDTTTGTATSNTQDITLTPFFSGIALDVTPQIDSTGNIILHIHPSVTEVEDQSKTITVNNTPQTLPLALSSIRESDSIVAAQNGQVVVIGGLMQNKTTDVDSRVPGLGDVPGVGNLFKHRKKAVVKSELVILLRATVADEAAWQTSVQQSQQRIKRLNGIR